MYPERINVKTPFLIDSFKFSRTKGEKFKSLPNIYILLENTFKFDKDETMFKLKQKNIPSAVLLCTLV